jgi:hypothetical protein
MEISNLQKRLKEETLSAHKEAENHPLMQGFIFGPYKEADLLQFLSNVLPLYQVVEQRLLQPFIFSNLDLKRSDLIKKDIESLVNKLQSDGKKSDYLGLLTTPLEVTDLWVAWCWAKPVDMLKADLYARWLADFYGGRMMAKNITPYDQMYQSNDAKGVIMDVRKIVDLESEISDDDIIEETINVFNYHVDLFKVIKDGNP